MEDSTKATLRSAAALEKVTDVLREMMREEDEESARPPPLPKNGNSSTKSQPPRK
jgi:hypothetical protein